ncbi:hypothetical protein KBY99_01665 [Cyanobium sp. Maggiore-St4-Cus]|uniref:hypothetical protein n=1 Tax=Cyanobium sp. Maggiore-St4-Cus TaxID=2823717 RepID=UPI0020CD4321|nr:hypothetical protein [Cyanobium sp. Maggiore-St4-Cus]MCP9787684.1 hypothetical protein [Cyanobium sp. Maggiore-St4-Cus]
MSSADRGFVYLAYGESYIKEAAHSALSLKAYHDEPISIIVPPGESSQFLEGFDQVISSELSRTYFDKTLIRLSPYKYTIHLDTDTLVLASLDDIFLLLEKFDVALNFGKGGSHYNLPEIPDSFPEPSAGVIAWAKNKSTQQLFELWEEFYACSIRRWGPEGAWDQRSLREALFHSNARIAPLLDRYQLISFFPAVVMSTVSIIHGRDISSSMVLTSVKRDGLRIFIPKLGTFGFDVPPPYRTFVYFRLSLCALRRFCELLVRDFLAYASIKPYPVQSRKG